MKALKVVGKIFAVLFCIVYFFVLSGLMTISFAMNLLSGNYYVTILKNVDLGKIKVSELGDAIDEIKGLDEIDIDEDTTVEEVLISLLKESGVDENTAIAIIENNEIREIIGNFIGDYMNYIAGDGERPKINKQDVKTILTNPDVVRAYGKQPTDEDIDKIYDQLNELANEIIENGGVKNDNSERINDSVVNFQ